MGTTIGLWGRPVDVPSLSPYVVTPSTPTGTSVSLYGQQYVTGRGRQSRRTWQWPVGHMHDAGLATLEQVASDARFAPLHWLDPTAHPNLIPADLAEPFPLPAEDAGPADVDGRTWQMVAGSRSRDVPTVAGVSYEVVVRAAAATTVTVEALDSEIRQVDRAVTSTVTSASGTGLVSVQWLGRSEPGVRVTVDGTWSGWQMFTQNRDPGGWRPGRGIPQVHVSGLTPELLWALRDGDVQWRSASVTLTEVDG